MKWHKVELHTHTIASDGDMLPNDLVDNALDRKYEAIALTDHNTTSSVAEAVAYGKKKKLIVIPGIELTTFWGHIVVTGGNSHIDWRDITLDNIDEILKGARDKKDLVTVAHPKRIGTPFCSECRFLFKLKDWSNVTSYEVWSHYMPQASFESKQTKEEWVGLLDKGYKIAPVYGFDWHTRDEGCPAIAYTYVGIVGDLTEEKILKAIEKSHTYISMGIEIDCKAVRYGNDYNLGDSLPSGEGEIVISANVVDEYAKYYSCEIKGMRFYKNNKLYLARKWSGEKISIPVEFDQGYFRVELYGTVDGIDGDVAILSPFYIK